MENKSTNTNKNTGGLYGKINMSIKTADIIISVLITALILLLIAAVV